MRIPNDQEGLAKYFIKYADLHQQCLVGAASSDKVNRAHDRLVLGVRRILQDRQGAIGLLRSLILHESVGVRLWAASYLMLVEPEAAKPVLTRIATMSPIEVGHANISAQTVLELWERGELRMAGTKGSFLDNDEAS